ncbi:MAG: hypothetical protein HOP02_14415 [Methylococcaceae bacterium]|nr:hypothetical protein [Methylococcaceae bacterium]
MNNQLINFLNDGIGFGRVIDFLKTLAGGDAEMPLAEVLIISRVLFVVVMFGFVGYFFDRMKQSVSTREIKTTKNKQAR